MKNIKDLSEIEGSEQILRDYFDSPMSNITEQQTF